MGTYRGNGNGNGSSMTNDGDYDDIRVDVELREAEREIARTRERLAQSITALRSEISSMADWRQWVAKNPAPFVAGAFGLGLLLGLRAASRA